MSYLTNLTDQERWLLLASAFGCILALGFLVIRPKRKRWSDPGSLFNQAPTLDLLNGTSGDDLSVERRTTIRRNGTTIPILMSDLNGLAPPRAGFVIDRSTGGLRIAARGEISIGTIMSVRTENAPETTPWVQVQVRSCSTTGDYYQIGCRFLEQPPWSVLLLFG